MIRKLTFSITSVLLISLGIIIVILSNTRADVDIIARYAFFIFSLIFIFSLLFLVSIVLARYNKHQTDKQFIKTQLRRSLLVSFALTGLVLFSAIHVLNILSAVTFIISLILIEMFFMTKKLEKTSEN